MAKSAFFGILALCALFVACSAQTGMQLNVNISSGSWATAAYNTPYPSAWITGTPASSGFGNSIYDSTTGRFYWSAPFSVGFTDSINDNTPTILRAWQDGPLNNFVRLYKNSTNNVEGFMAVVHDISVEIISLVAPDFYTIIPPYTIPGALQVRDVLHQPPYLIITYLVSGDATSGFWYNYGTSATGTMTLSSNRRCFVSFYHSGLNNLYWGCLGGFLWNSANNRPLDSGGTTVPTFVTAGAGNFTTGLLHTSANRLYLGSSIGLGISIDLTTNTATQLFFTFGSSSLSELTSIVMDTATANSLPALFWGTNDGRVVRVNTRDFTKVFASANTGVRELLNTAHIVDGQPIFGFGYKPGETTTNNNYHTYSLVKSNCSNYGCAQCLGAQNVDKEYCGMCIDTGLCTTAAACSGESWTQSGICPSADSVTLATSGSINGGTVSQFNGAYFKTGSGELANYKCRYFSGATTTDMNAIALDATSVRCTSPSWPTATIVNVLVMYKSRVWAGNWQFSYYDCAATTSCSQCGTGSQVSQTECGWCFATSSCTAASSCAPGTSPDWRKAVCPSVGTMPAVNVSRSQDGSSFRFTVPVTNFLNNNNLYECRFPMTSGINNVTALPVTSGSTVTAIECVIDPTSAVTSEGQLFTAVTIGRRSTPGTVYGITPNNGLEVYDCPDVTTCFTCRSRSKCGWCEGTSTCAYLNGIPCTPASACTTISSATQANMFSNKISIGQAEGAEFTIQGTNIQPPSFVPDSCFWKLGVLTPDPTTFIIDSNTQGRCNAPATMSAGTYALSLGLIGPPERVLTNALTITVYDCATRMSCGSCISADPNDRCRWCAAIASPGCTETVGSCTNWLPKDSTQCPRITSAQPNVFPVDGGVNVTLIGPHQLTVSDASSAECAFQTVDGVQYSALTLLSTTEVLCAPVPSVTAASNATINIVSTVGIKPNVTNGVPMEYALCEQYKSCDQCIGSEFSFCNWCGATCSSNCSADLTHLACPTYSYISPNYSIVTGGDKISVIGSNFLVSAKRASNYRCVWDASTSTEAIVENPSTISCITPARTLDTILPLSIEYNGLPYLSTPGLEFFSCASPQADHCLQTCAARPHCGWCLASQTCLSEYQCGLTSSQWQSGTCPFATLDTTVVPTAGEVPVTATLSNTLPTGSSLSDLACTFGEILVPASSWVAGNESEAISSQVTCIVPAVDTPTQTRFSIQYRSNAYIEPITFSYDDCSLYTGCTQCIAATNCGWCSRGSKCTFQSQCGGSASWNKDSCPLNKAALGAGLGVGLFALIVLALLALFLIRRARKRRGLVIELKEPNYDEIAWGTDVTLAWRVPEHEYKVLETGLSRKDFLLQLAIAFNCPATEQDAMAKALVYVASVHGIAAEMIQTCIRKEVQTCKQENTLFRNNSVASKMYKFFSRIVGIKYLFNCIARVILELEILGRQQDTKKPDSSQGSNEVSLLSMSMELDQTKVLGDDLDTDTNLLQLQLICQKLLNVIIKTSLRNIPAPFRKIFVEIDNSVMGKFAGSNDAVYKGIGGLFFLRFVCPAITAPHVYGLLENPPNTVTQRQLVLISKVIQNIANMQPPGKKEEYMTALSDFIVQSIPKIIKFYDNLRMAVNVPQAGEADEQTVDVPNEVRLNGLASIWNFLYTEKAKVKAWTQSPECPFTEEEKGQLMELLLECESEYTSAPKKLKQGATAELERKPSKKKTK